MKPVKVFYSYAHEDKALRDELDKHLGNLKRQGLIDVWHDRDISAGTEWEREIDKNLNRANLILLLISPNFIHSDYCFSKEMHRAIERCEAKQAYIIPIILRSCVWEDLPFSKYQVLPKNEQPVNSRYWRNHDEAFSQIARGITEVVHKFRERNEGSSTNFVRPTPIEEITTIPKIPRPAHETNKIRAKKQALTAEAYIPASQVIKKPLPRRHEMSSVAVIGRNVLAFMQQNFSGREIERSSKGYSLLVLFLLGVFDLILLPAAFNAWLHSDTWLSVAVICSLIVFALGVMSKKNYIAILLSFIYLGAWFTIGYYFLAWPITTAFVASFVFSILHLFLFRRHAR